MSNSNEPNRPARAGAGIRVAKERLAPLGTSGGFFAIGLATFALIPLWIAWRGQLLEHGAVAHPHIVTLVHLYVLAWGTSVALGAVRQLSVVLFQAPDVGPPSRGWSALLLHALGLVALLAGMISQDFEYTAIGGVLILGAIVVTIGAVVGSARRGDRRSLVVPFLAGALLAMVGTALFGTLLALNRVSGLLGDLRTAALASHLYLGPVGWFGLLIPGISYELAPFFGLTRGGDEKGIGRYERVVAGFLISGLTGGFLAALFGVYHPAWLLPLAAGYLLFVFDLRGIFRSRPLIRRTATLVGVRAAHVSLAALVVMLLVGVVQPDLWVDGRWLTTFGWIGLAGWITNSVAGYLHRILPFLAWHTRYWGAGKEEIRTRFQDMVDQRLGRVGFYLYNGGLGVALAGIWGLPSFWLGLVLLGVGTWILTFNLARVYVR